jgi:glycosyltransferase involved in cell wall biosynthesis
MQAKQEHPLSTSQPTRGARVSVGIPVYNGERYLREAIDSVLSQTLTDFEVVISDNASTDATESICREYAAGDPRVRYIRQDRNVGAEKNFHIVLAESRGDYFTWLAHDDFLYPEFLEKLAGYLDRHEDVVLCLSDFHNVNEKREIKATISPEEIRESKDWIIARRQFFLYKHGVHVAIYGVFRSVPLKSSIHQVKMTGFLGMINGSEFSLLAVIALLGRIVSLPEILRVHRLHKEANSTVEMSRSSWFAVVVNMIYVVVLRLFKTLVFSDLSLREKFNTTIIMLKYHIPVLFKIAFVSIFGLRAGRYLKKACHSLLMRQYRTNYETGR